MCSAVQRAHARRCVRFKTTTTERLEGSSASRIALLCLQVRRVLIVMSVIALARSCDNHTVTRWRVRRSRWRRRRTIYASRRVRKRAHLIHHAQRYNHTISHCPGASSGALDDRRDASRHLTKCRGDTRARGAHLLVVHAAGVGRVDVHYLALRHGATAWTNEFPSSQPISGDMRVVVSRRTASN